MKKELTDRDYCDAAGELGCDPALVRAVAEVESSGSGFIGDKPTILYERHVFYRNAPRDKRAAWAAEHPDLCHPQPYPKGGYGPKSAQYLKLREAAKLDLDAALKACSWGAFQELGENYKYYGFATVSDFVKEMRSGADGHLRIFVKSIIHRGLTDEFQNPTPANIRTIARLYNGPAYAKFDYHGKIADRYRKYKGKVKCEGTAEAQPEAVQRAEPEKAPVPAPTVFETIESAGAKFATVDTVATRVSAASWIVTIWTKVWGWVLLVAGIATSHPEWAVLAVILIVAAVAYLYTSKERGLKRDLSAHSQ